MQLVDLRSFKTRKCDQAHHPALSPSFLNCPNFHSKFDRRRNPFSQNQAELVYSEVYVQDFYSTQMSSNYVEYMFHPRIYKTLPCKSRYNPNFEAGLDYPGNCPHLYCPYIHENEDVSSLAPYRNMPDSLAPEPEFAITGAKELKELLEKPKHNLPLYQKEIDEIKAELKRVKLTVKIEEIKEPEAPKLQEKKQPVLTNAQKMSKTTDENWYTAYTYFQYGQKLPIIEDRHHEFKNFRDIINNSITPIVMKYIAAFLNSEGGVLYIGIDDSSIVNGFQITQHEFDKFLLSIDKEGKFNLYPPLMPQKYAVKRIPVYHHRRNKDIWVIEIKITPVEKDKKILTTYNRECFMRMNASTHKLDAMDLIQYIRLNHEDKLSERESLKEVSKALDKPSTVKTVEELTELKELLTQLTSKVDSRMQRAK